MAAAIVSRRALRTHARSTRAKPHLNYAESSTSSEDDDKSGAMNDEELEAERPTRRNRTRTLHMPQAVSNKRRRLSYRSHDPDNNGNEPAKKRKRPDPTVPKSLPTTHGPRLLASGVVPPWQKLPYLILVEIFQYATYPLYDEHTFQPLPSGKWLLQTAIMCRAFTEPALTVLYTSPPLVPMVQAHQLVDLLKQHPAQLAYKYRQKVESLRIDVGQVVAYSLPGSGHLDLHGLIKDLPRLAELEFYHQLDMSPYRSLDSNIKWTYPASIFEALEYVDPTADPTRGDKSGICRLKSWRWSSRLAGKRWPIQKIPEIHLKPSFASLRKVAFVNYQIPMMKKDEEDPVHENILAMALKNLQNLEHLIFESSTLMNAKLLPLLPQNLRTLEIINCWEIVAEDFASFLSTHGNHLRCLSLHHNQSLSLSFLPVLGEACPRLEALRMNLVYYNLHATYRDSEPQYEKLLFPGDVPAWPSTLQTIELTQMRKWETEAAEMFFQSLLNSAESLPALRKLNIQAILNIGWRDRASFRDKWVGSLARVFKRVSEPPRSFIYIGKDILNDGSTSAASAGTCTSYRDLANIEDNFQSPILSDRSIGNNVSGVLSSSSVTSSTKATIGQEKTPPTRRSARASTRQLERGRYVEPGDDAVLSSPTEQTGRSLRFEAHRAKLQKEIATLRDTAGFDSAAPRTSPTGSVQPSSPDDEDENRAEERVNNKWGSKKEVIQGMCEIVEVRIDNLRPTETQVTEADFLDEEASGDEDWDGDDDRDDGYAW